MTFTRRPLAFFLVSLTLWLLPSSARAWIETHLLGDDVRIEVESSGAAIVEHAITMRLRGGPLRSFDLLGADRDALPLEGSHVVPAKAGDSALPIPLSIVQRPDGALRVSIEHPRGLRRGTFLFRLRYRTNLLATGALERDGAMLRLAWAGPIWPEGFGNARCTFVLPPAPTAPRSAQDDIEPLLEGEADAEAATSFLAELRRHADRDEIELVRPHVSRREQALWAIRFDPRALGEVSDARLQPPPPPPVEATALERALGWAPIAGLLLVAFSLLVAAKGQEVQRFGQAAGLRPRPLVPLASIPRALLAGPIFAAGIGLQTVLDEAIAGTLLVLFAAALTTYLTPHWKPRPRGPGRWLPLKDADAFAEKAPSKGPRLDIGAPAGRRALVLAMVAFALAATATWHFASPYYGYLVAFDAAVLLPLFGTGRLVQLPPDPVTASSRRLRRIAEKLRKKPWLRAVAWARLPQGGDRFDELRLLVMPRLPRRGLSGIEVGIAWARGAGGALAVPQVLVRVVDGSPCHEALTAHLGAVSWTRGRKPDERVALLTPELPTTSMTAALALRIAEAARDPERSRGQRQTEAPSSIPNAPAAMI